MESLDLPDLNFQDRELLTRRDLFIRSYKSALTTKWNGLSWPHAENTWHAATHYFGGLLKPGDNKTMRGLSDRMGIPEDRLQQFITESPWEHDAVQTHLNQSIPPHFQSDDAILNVDGVAFLKEGDKTVGVGRQYAGCVGKVDNCHVGVDLTMSVPDDTRNANQITWPLGMKLYLPEDWVTDDDYADRREAVGLPEDISFQTKPEIALGLLERARDAAVPHACIGGDTAFGNNREFRSQLRDWNESYLLKVTPSKLRVIPEQTPLERPEDYTGPGRLTDPRYPEEVTASSPRELADTIEDENWTELTWGKGTKGDLSGKFARQRVRVVKSVQRRAVTEETGWLLLEEQDGELKSWLCWGVDEWSLEKQVLYAHQRWWVEQFHREAKQVLGINQFEGRTWGGWHHHVTVVLLAYGFLSTERARSEKDNSGGLPPLSEIADDVTREYAIHYLIGEMGIDRPRAKEVATGFLRYMFGIG